jgi:hypothetical protein
MNRDIEFRGKDKTGKWVYGFYYEAYGKHVIWGCVSGGNTQCVYGVIPETVGQYTGLKDKNGAKIFEGDIVAVLNHMGVSYHAVEDIFNFAIWFDHTIARSNSSLEVIGNIHDNPKILEVQNREWGPE